MKKANTQENIRGVWITRDEIHQLRNDISREIENKRNPQQNEPSNADVAIEGEHVDLSHISYHQNKTLQPSDINENELLKIKEKLVNAYAEASLLFSVKDFNLKFKSLEKVNHVVEATPLLTKKKQRLLV